MLFTQAPFMGSGAPPVPPGMVELFDTAFSTPQAMVVFSLDPTYDEFVLEVLSMNPAAASDNPYMRFSTNGGVSFDSGAAAYVNAADGCSQSSTTRLTLATVTSQVQLSVNNADNGLGAARGGFAASIKIMNAASTRNTKAIYDTAISFASQGLERMSGVAEYLSGTRVNAVQLYFGAGAIASGVFKLYGLRKNT